MEADFCLKPVMKVLQDLFDFDRNFGFLAKKILIAQEGQFIRSEDRMGSHKFMHLTYLRIGCGGISAFVLFEECL